MKKICKRTLAVLLCVLLLVGIVPLGVLAVEDEDSTVSMYTDSYDMTGVDGVGKILTKAASSNETQENSGYSFSYLSVDGKTASVGFNNAEACTLVVAVYSEDDGQMLGSGIKTVGANIFSTTVDIDIATMPQYFILKAFLLDANMAALCKPFSVIEYSKQFEQFDKKTTDDFNGNVIINFDEQKDDNFAVLVDGAKEITSTASSNTLVSYDADSGKYVFKNINNAIKSLSIGDVFEFESNGELYLLKVKTISVSGSTATIYEDLTAEHSDYFKYIDVDESSDTNGSDMTVDMTNAEEGIEFLGISDWDDELQTQSLVDVNNNWSAGPEWKIREKYLVGDSDSDVSVKVSGKIKAALGFNIRIYYDADWEWKWDFWDSYSDYFYCQLKIDFKIQGSVTATGSLKHDFRLGDIDFVTPVGIVVSINVLLHVEASASITIEIASIGVTIGFKYDEDSGFQNLCSGPNIDVSPKLQGQAEFKVGLKLGPGISFVKVVEISLKPEAGGKITLKTDQLDAAQLLNLKSVDQIHACSWINCFNGEVSIYGTCKLEGRFFNKKKDTTIMAEFTRKISDCHLKISPLEFRFQKCPNIAYRCDFTVVNKDDKPITNLDVKSGGPDLGDNYKYNVQNATDCNGQVSFFYPKGSYTATFVLNGKEAATKSLTVADTKKSITITIDTSETDGGGSGHNGGTGGSNLGNYTAAFSANGGAFADGTTTKTLTVKAGDPITAPDDPTRNNYYFAGWNPDLPDVMPSKNTTFTATWSTTPVTGSADNLSNIGTKGATVQFGAYPQSKVTNSATISALNSRASGWVSYEYYTGSGSRADGKMTASDYMQYCDVKYGGNKYRGVKFSHYRPSSTDETSSASVFYQDDNGYTTGTTYWFKYEPLKWKVLDPSTGLVMCATIIDSQPYNNYFLESGTDPRGESAYWGDAGKTHYASDYAESSLRQWLNQDFYATAFTRSQQNKIAVNRNQNNDGYRTLIGRSGYTDFDSDPTNDKIFLLSFDEVTNSSYGFASFNSSDSARELKGSDYAQCQGLDAYYTFWWLRSPGYYSNGASHVGSRGDVGCNYTVNDTSSGVCPAFKFNPASYTYTATFSANGGAFADGTTTKTLTVKAGDPITAPGDPTRNIYDFAGWNPDLPDVMPSKNTTFTATWSTTPVTGYADGTGSADNLSNVGTKGATVQFGAYPQSKVTDSATISALNSRASGWVSYEYYTGSTGSGSPADGKMTASDYMQYCDVKYGGNKYRGVKFSHYRPSSTGETSSSVSYQDDNGYTTGTTYWFKYEPLKWKVLDPSTGLVMCATIIDSQPYNNYILESGTDPRGESAYWGDAGKTHYASDYAESSLRQWLNQDFYATAFTRSQQNKIAVNRNQNNDGYYTLKGNSNYTYLDSDPTNDKIFLLSWDEVTNSSYGFDSSDESCDSAGQLKGSDYAQCQGLYVNRSSGSAYNGNSEWWLRSPGYFSCYACFVYDNGYVSDCERVGLTCFGVCPAFKFNPASLSTQSAAATNAAGKASAYDYAYSACEAGGDYILLNVTGYGSSFTLTTGSLQFIDRLTADENGKVCGSFVPRSAASGSTTLLIGDFGSGVEARKITATAQTDTHTHSYTSAVTKQPTCTEPGVMTYTCSCGSTYDESVPATGKHTDADNDGLCDSCHKQMTGDGHCKYCGKIHTGFFAFFVKIFHRLFSLFGKTKHEVVR